jgi:hypothetical protein
MKGSGEQTGSQVSGDRVQSNEKMRIAVLFVFVGSLGRVLDELFSQFLRYGLFDFPFIGY